MNDPRVQRTRGIQRSASAPSALGDAIRNSAYAGSAWEAHRAARDGGPDGGHDHGDGGEHGHDHIESRITDHEGRIANLEGQGGVGGDGSQ